MSLFLKPLGEISFSEVQAFCNTYEEGIRVEYKESPVNISKVVSSFANTSGGIWVIGVKEDPVTHTRQIVGLPKGPGYEEQIVQSCLTGVYPPIRPAVREILVEGEPDKAVIVVKVEESTEAPHAIDKSTRAYVRTASVSQPNDLADMDRLEYFFKRRQNAESKRESLITKALEHCVQHHYSRVQVIVCPTFPYQPVKSLDDINQFVAEKKYDGRQSTQAFYGRMRQIQDGMINTSNHLELNTHGLVLHDRSIDVGERPRTRGEGKQPYIWVGEPVVAIGNTLNIAQEFIRDTVLNVCIRVKLSKCRGIWLVYHRDRFDDEMPGADHTCFDEEIQAEMSTTIEGLNGGIVQTVTELMTQVIWAFNRPTEGLKDRIKEILLQNHLL